MGFPDPEPGAELLGQTAGTDDTAKADKREQSRAMNREQEEPDALDLLATEELADWQEQMAPIINPVLQLANEVDSYETFLEALPSLIGDMDAMQVIRHLAEATFKARGMGDATDEL